MTKIAQRRTAVEPAEAIATLADAYREVLGRSPSADTLAILVAHTALETGHWRAMWNWNFGNIRGNYQGWTQAIANATENIDGEEVPVPNGFRAYPSQREGASDYIRFLALDTTPFNGKPNRYAKAWEAAERGHVDGFALELKAAGYYTAPADDYLRELRSCFRRYADACRPDTEPAPASPAALAILDDIEAQIGHLRAELERRG